MIELSGWQFFGVIAGSFTFGVIVGCVAMALFACFGIARGCRELEVDD
jgi:purine-cytosine permease-like protein